MQVIIQINNEEDRIELTKYLKEHHGVKLTGFIKYLITHPEAVDEICEDIPDSIEYKWKSRMNKEND